MFTTLKFEPFLKSTLMCIKHHFLILQQKKFKLPCIVISFNFCFKTFKFKNMLVILHITQ